MANDIDQSIRSDLSTKQSQIKVVAGREPSIAELTENKPVMRYVPGTGLMMYVRYNNKRYHVKFSDDPRQEGKIRVEDVGSMEHITDSFIGPGQGGTGQDLSGSTGAISVSGGTVAAGTLPIAVGGTATTANTTWINTNVQTNTDGTLNHTGSGSGAVTMNTLTDANDIRSRITAGLASNGNVSRTVALAQGGLGADVSSSAGFVKLGSGSATIRSTTDTKSDLSLNNVANERQINTFAQDGIPTSVAAGDIWIDTNDDNKVYRAAAAAADAIEAGGWIAVTPAKGALGLSNVVNERQINTFAQDAIPTSVAAGDIWIDTDDDNKIYRAASAGANEITGGEWVAVQAGKSAVGLPNVDNTSDSTKQAATLSAATKSDVGLSAVDNNSTATILGGNLTGSVNSVAVSTVTAGAAAGATAPVTFSQDAVPTALNAGDLWIDTNDDNKMYRATATGDDVIGSGEWIAVTVGKGALGLAKGDVGLGSADNLSAADIRAGTTKANVGLTDVDDLSATDIRAGTTAANVGLNLVANERQINTFVASSSGTIPTAVAAGDLWVDSGADNKLYRAAAAGADAITAGEWVAVQAGNTAVGLSNVANVDTRDLDNMNAGTLAVARGGTNAGNSNDWLNTRVKIQTDGTLEYDNTTDGAVTMNTLADANNIRARVTGSLASANGLNTGVAIGDAVQSAVIYNGDAQEARLNPATADYTVANSNVWEQDDTTEIIKIAFNYLHNANNRGLKLSCLLRSGNGSYEARVKLSVYLNTVGGSFSSGSLPDTSGSPIVSVVKATTKTVFDGTHTSSMLGLTTGSGSGEVTDGQLYKITIGLYNENSGTTSYMSAPTVTCFGSTS